MGEEIRIVGHWEIINAVKLGDREMVVGSDVCNTDGERYMTAFSSQDKLEGVFTSNDYTQIVEFFGERIINQANKIRAERSTITIPRGIVYPEHCYPNYFNKSIKNKVVAIMAVALRPEYQTTDNQIVLCTGGFGSRANAHEKDCICINLYSGKQHRIERCKIQGQIKPEYMPAWARERLAEIKAQLAADHQENKDNAR